MGSRNGYKPPPPPSHASSGSSGKPGPIVVRAAILIFALPALGFAAAIGYAVLGHLS